MANTLNTTIISIVIIFLVLLLFFAIFLSSRTKNTSLRTSLTTSDVPGASTTELDANKPLGHQLLLNQHSKFMQQGFTPVFQNISDAVLMSEDDKFVSIHDNKVSFTERPEMSYSYIPSSSLLVLRDDEGERVVNLNGEKQIKMHRKGNQVIISTPDARMLGHNGLPLKFTLLAKRD